MCAADAVPDEPLAGAILDPGELLDVDVHELAGMAPLVAVRGLGRLQPRQLAKAEIEKSLLAFLAEAAQPLRQRADAHSGGLGRRHKRPAFLEHPLHRQAATTGTGPRVSVQLHPVSSLGLVA